MCQEFHCLPEEGGLLDQDQLIVRKMQIILNAQAERRERERQKREAKQNSGKGRR